MNDDMIQMMADSEEKVLKENPEGSFLHMFWQQQKEAASRPCRGRCWHPMTIKWCIYLRHQSNKAYETLRESGCIYLPSQRSLRDYTNCVRAGSGFSSEVDNLLMNTAKVTTSHDWQKLVVLLLDEIPDGMFKSSVSSTRIVVTFNSCT